MTLMHCQPVGLYLQLRPGLLYRALHAASCPTCCIVPCMLHRALHAASGPTCCIGPYMLHRALHAASGPTGHLPIRRPCPPGPGPRRPAGAALALLAPRPWGRPGRPGLTLAIAPTPQPQTRRRRRGAGGPTQRLRPARRRRRPPCRRRSRHPAGLVLYYFHRPMPAGGRHEVCLAISTEIKTIFIFSQSMPKLSRVCSFLRPAPAGTATIRTVARDRAACRPYKP